MDPTKLPGYAAAGALVIGVSGFVLGLVAVFFGDFSGVGLCLSAAALAFGLLANAIYRR
jgi:hypothetical protein